MGPQGRTRPVIIGGGGGLNWCVGCNVHGKNCIYTREYGLPDHTLYANYSWTYISIGTLLCPKSIVFDLCSPLVSRGYGWS